MIKEEFPFIKKLQKSGDVAIRTVHNDMQDGGSVVAGGDCSAASGNITTVILKVFTSHLHQILPLIPLLYAYSVFPILSTFLSHIINISSPRKKLRIFFFNFKAKMYVHLEFLLCTFL